MNALLGLANLLGGYMAGRQMRRQEDTEAEERRKRDERYEREWSERTAERDEDRKARERVFAAQTYAVLRDDIKSAMERGDRVTAGELAAQANSLASQHGLPQINIDAYAPDPFQGAKDLASLAEVGLPFEVARNLISSKYGAGYLSGLVPPQQPSPQAATPAPGPAVVAPPPVDPHALDEASHPDGLPAPVALTPMEILQPPKPKATPFTPEDPVSQFYNKLLRRQDQKSLLSVLPSLTGMANSGAPGGSIRAAASLVTEDPDILSSVEKMENPTQVMRWQSVTEKNDASAALDRVKSWAIPKELQLEEKQLDLKTREAKTREERQAAELELAKARLRIAEYLAKLRAEQLELDRESFDWKKEIDLLKAENYYRRLSTEASTWDTPEAQQQAKTAGERADEIAARRKGAGEAKIGVPPPGVKVLSDEAAKREAQRLMSTVERGGTEPVLPPSLWNKLLRTHGSPSVAMAWVQAGLRAQKSSKKGSK